jgi:GTP cyclohydrolase II
MLGQRRSLTEPSGSADSADAALAQIARAADALRAGTFVQIQDQTGSGAAVLATETANREDLRRFETAVEAPLLVLTHARARTLKIRLYTPEIVGLRLAPPFDPERLRAIADPTADLAEPLKGPFEAVREPMPDSYSAAIKLAKLSGLLPAVIAGPGELAPPAAVSVRAAIVENYSALVTASLKLVTRARVPLQGAEGAELAAFRAGTGGPEHYAILIGDPPRNLPVLTRLHSECFTGDLLGSLRCDCGAQLRGAIKSIAEAGGGILVYLAQEGRGIGLINKLRAYRLQDEGFDTLEANERLGFEPDERLYGIAARILTLVGFNSVRLMTNNPHKLEALKSAGIDVVARVPHAFPANIHNNDYLRTKAHKAGHLL